MLASTHCPHMSNFAFHALSGTNYLPTMPRRTTAPRPPGFPRFGAGPILARRKIGGFGVLCRPLHYCERILGAWYSNNRPHDGRADRRVTLQVTNYSS